MFKLKIRRFLNNETTALVDCIITISCGTQANGGKNAYQKQNEGFKAVGTYKNFSKTEPTKQYMI